MGSLAERLIRNTLSSAAGFLVSLAVSLLLAPYMLSMLGAEAFGVWIILSVAAAYFTLLDLGVSASFIKHLAEARAKGEHRRHNEIMATGWLFYLAFSLLVVLLGLAVQGPLLRVLSVPADAVIVYWGVLAIFAVRNSFIIYRSLLFSLQRLDVLNGIEIVSALLNLAGTVTVLSAGHGLVGVMAVNLGVAVAHVAAEVTMAWHLSSGLSPAPWKARMKTFRMLFRYGIQLQASRCAELVHWHADKLILSHFVGLAQVTAYELGAKVASLTRSFPTVLLPAILPAAATLEAQRNRADLLRLYDRGSKYLAAAALPLAGFTLLSAPLIIGVWLGADHPDGAVPAVRALAVAYLFQLLTGMGLAIARGIGVVHYEMRSLAVSAAMNVGLSLLLVAQFGLPGVLAATALSTVTGYLLFMGSLHGYLKRSFLEFARQVYALPAAGVVIAAAMTVLANYPMAPLRASAAASRASGLALLLIDAALFFSVYAAVLLKARYIALGDLSLVRKALASRS